MKREILEGRKALQRFAEKENIDLINFYCLDFQCEHLSQYQH